MSYYFYCPGAASATATTVECSVAIQTYTPPESVYFTPQNVQSFIVLALTFWAMHYVFQQLKKAIEQ
ncbi:hypothetical protein A264_28511 [Pseudomonas syringae pv. actinidiae ICMP 19071]|nr:hypothetical protein A264_28511 [Pseudomonas syringae pv. actinidiae ICMP 19071]EPM73878.1 hypothetical protein A3SO_27733 [Pseudomonas syringae pv. actinidiae ICMP 19072]